MKRIEFLEDTYGNSKGERVNLIQEIDDEIYYNDGFKRYCYLLKSEEGKVFKVIK